MNNRDWCDDGDYKSAVEQAEHMTRVGWKAIAGVTGLMGIAAVTVAVFCLAVVVGMAYLVVVATP
ncbi:MULTISPECIES: hypothetical protein [unclassified Streptomyces]|uniref:hypothetical protein n=1 Tax=unclassified Streptomyces TaxID=2593676 RepID=UPI002DDBA057|nr:MULTISPECIES: hypothetical protein [unclassified Streptomyces]WSF83672.1 hypothetical protein OIE70_11660 [Streptomyces sp. NBC_01744]WSC40046.1 hypothetical protein OHA08_33535 [Streptomyces sp. NBC_01763]WSC48212.1 hypothetical protein OIE61_31940 [Streptomyces sp. NBC_01762]WSC52826.1 hypothetical protein OG808_11560 [Streptomyces sp. NBC_01761]WSD27861.1 hypothetical protein OHA26_32655 [Streptomyces sp. NBC_01751]